DDYVLCHLSCPLHSERLDGPTVAARNELPVATGGFPGALVPGQFVDNDFATRAQSSDRLGQRGIVIMRRENRTSRLSRLSARNEAAQIKAESGSGPTATKGLADVIVTPTER